MVDKKKQFNFQTLAQKGKIVGNVDNKASREWFRNEALSTRTSATKYMENPKPFQLIGDLSVNSIGKLYLFQYDPKHKDTLPYYDIYPLVFPIGMDNDRMLGLNMHYLSPPYRAKLMNALYSTLNNDKYNKTTQLQISYQILKGASQFKYFKPTVHSYLWDHVRSPFMNIQSNLWDYTLFLPLAQFRKKSQDVVWMESMLKV